jgi:hypothetical protein
MSAIGGDAGLPAGSTFVSAPTSEAISTYPIELKYALASWVSFGRYIDVSETLVLIDEYSDPVGALCSCDKSVDCRTRSLIVKNLKIETRAADFA